MINIYTLEVNEDGITTHYLSFTDDLALLSNSKNLIGYLKEPSAAITHENIIYNPEFADMFHKVVMLTTLQAQDAATAIINHPDGFLFITDERAEGGADKKHIAGSFVVRNGKIDPVSYQPNAAYQFINEKGPWKIPGDFDEYLRLAINT